MVSALAMACANSYFRGTIGECLQIPAGQLAKATVIVQKDRGRKKLKFQYRKGESY